MTNKVTRGLVYMPIDGHEFYAKTEPDNPESESFSHVKVIYAGVCIEIPDNTVEIATKVSITHPGEEPEEQWINIDVLKQMMENNAPQTYKGEATIRWQAEEENTDDGNVSEPSGAS